MSTPNQNLRRPWLVPLVGPVLCCLAFGAPPTVQAQEGIDFTSDFFLEECSFSNRGSNLFFSLEPGTRAVLVGDEDGTEIEVVITVLQDTFPVDFTTPAGKRIRLRARVVEERESEDGELVEVSRNYFARCRETGDIYYFGEAVDDYEDGEIVGHEGEWVAGEDGNLPGIAMPGTFLLGSAYYQEQAPGIALDVAWHTAMGLDLELGAGEFERCVEVTEANLFEPEGEPETKYYCPHVGLVVDADAELEEYSSGSAPAAPKDTWWTAPGLADFRVQMVLSADGEELPVSQEVAACDADTVCAAGSVPGRVEAFVRVPGPRPNGCYWPTISKLTTSQVEVWVERLSTGEVRHYVVDGSSQGSDDLPGFFDRTGFCDG